MTVSERESLEAAKNTTKELLGELFGRLKESEIGGKQAAERIFFPKGIELIDVAIKVGLPNTPLVDVHFRVEGHPHPKAVFVDALDENETSGDGSAGPGSAAP